MRCYGERQQHGGPPSPSSKLVLRRDKRYPFKAFLGSRAGGSSTSEQAAASRGRGNCHLLSYALRVGSPCILFLQLELVVLCTANTVVPV